jgi:hypothetical protein
MEQLTNLGALPPVRVRGDGFPLRIVGASAAPDSKRRGSRVISQSHFGVGQCHGSRDAVAESVKKLGFALHATLMPNSYSHNLNPTLGLSHVPRRRKLC